MKIRRVISLLAAVCLLFTLSPRYALAVEGEEGGALWVKDSGIELRLLPQGEAEAQGALSADRIRNIFPDPALAQVIAGAFHVTVDAVVTQEDLERVISFSAEGRGIRNLQGMERLTALREVNLNRNQISDLSPLAGQVNLERLLLDGNQIADIAPLSGLTNLQWLWLDDNQIRSIRPLEGLENLEWLTLRVNQITDIAPLQGLTRLQALWLGGNQIRDIGPLAGLTNLETLMLADNQIGDMRPLAALRWVRQLWIGEQDIVLPGRIREDPLVMENLFFCTAGKSVPPREISDGGVYLSPYLRWTGLGAERVRYTVVQDITVGLTSDRLYGTVTQTLRSMPFLDIRLGDWFYEAVVFMSARGLMGGTSDTAFSPNAGMSRGMVVTILHRMAGLPSAFGDMPFRDVPAGMWFTEAAVWAYEQGIVRGYGDPRVFAPHVIITRGEFAVMLYRYALTREQNMAVPPDFTLDVYMDYGQISDWAREAVGWSVYRGLIRGTAQGVLAPRGPAARAEGAMILMRYLLWSD